MSTRRVTTISNTILYIVAAVVIVVAFLSLGGWSWLKGMMNENGLMEMGIFNSLFILIWAGIGLILGFWVLKRKW